MVHEKYSPLRVSHNVSVRPPTRTARGESVELTTEEVDPQVPVHRDAQESLVDDDKGGCLRDGVGGEVVKLHLVVVAQPPHKLARGGVEAALVQADEADDVT
jgi:hypothetical protein